MANKIKIKANKGGIRYFGSWGIIPREVREQLASYEPTNIDASYLRFMDVSSYEVLEEKAEEPKVMKSEVVEEKPKEVDVSTETVKEEPKKVSKSKSKKKTPKKDEPDLSTEDALEKTNLEE